MDALDYLDNYIIGQDKLKPEIASLMDAMLHGDNINILIRGASGYGKTHLATVISNYVDISNSAIFVANQINDGINFKYRIYILDEIHLVNDPEFLYPLMDSGNFCFLLLTNEFDALKEPLANRCIPISLLNYTEEELAIIIYRTLLQKGIRLNNLACLQMASCVRGNPRIAKITAKRLSIIMRRLGITNINDDNEINEILEMYLGISQGGFTEYDKQYIEFLSVNKIASIDTLTRMLALPKDTILKEIEPFLIKKNLIRITPRGRSYIGN